MSRPKRAEDPDGAELWLLCINFQIDNILQSQGGGEKGGDNGNCLALLFGFYLDDNLRFKTLCKF